MKTLDDYKTFLAGVHRQTGLEALTAIAAGRAFSDRGSGVTFSRFRCKQGRKNRQTQGTT
ncbi:MAG: hypothetical protein IJ173_04150 [Kiritimatiellae bacterium]|nr:hypothetical protein [Kiritimatiellia bacterium]